MSISLPYTPDIEAIIFDFDGTLAFTGDDHFDAWRLAHHEFGRDLSRQEFIDNLSHSGAKEIASKLGEGALEVFKNALHRSVEPPFNNQLWQLAEENWPKYPKAVCTGSPGCWARKVLEKRGVFSKFKVFVGNEDYPKGKPHPDPFLVTLERLGIGASKVAVFEDTYLGAKSAKSAGIEHVFLGMKNGTTWQKIEKFLL